MKKNDQQSGDQPTMAIRPPDAAQHAADGYPADQEAEPTPAATLTLRGIAVIERPDRGAFIFMEEAWTPV